MDTAVISPKKARKLARAQQDRERSKAQREAQERENRRILTRDELLEMIDENLIFIDDDSCEAELEACQEFAEEIEAAEEEILEEHEPENCYYCGIHGCCERLFQETLFATQAIIETRKAEILEELIAPKRAKYRALLDQRIRDEEAHGSPDWCSVGKIGILLIDVLDRPPDWVTPRDSWRSANGQD